MEDKKKFGDFITLNRKKFNLTQKELAKKLYVTESAVSKWERGLSYPDITLIKSICEVFNITEHELITASEDTQGKINFNYVRKYKNMIKLYSYTLNILYLLTLLVCFIVSIATGGLWFLIVFASIIVAYSLTLLPLKFKKHKLLKTSGAFYCSLNLLLLVISIYSKGDWFFLLFVILLFTFAIIFLPIILNKFDFEKFLIGIKIPLKIINHKVLICLIIDSILLFIMLAVINNYVEGDWYIDTALPIALYGLLLPWFIMITIRYLKVNSLFIISINLFNLGVYSILSRSVINMIIDKDSFNLSYAIDFRIWSNEYINGNIIMIIFLTFSILGIIFTIFAVKKNLTKSN